MIPRIFEGTPSLFDQPTERASRERFEQFDAAHPEVYREFCRIAKVLRDEHGHAHYSADGVMHVVRFHTRAGADPSQHEFKINNNHVAFYARKLIAEDPSFSSFFRTRRQRRAS